MSARLTDERRHGVLKLLRRGFSLFAERVRASSAARGHDGGSAAMSALSARGHDVEKEFAAYGGGVESFCEGTEGDSTFTEIVNGVDDVANGTPEPPRFQTPRTSPSWSRR